MNAAAARRYCDRRPGAVAGYPFGPGARAYKAGGKIFAILGATSISLKCDPVLAELLRRDYPAVTPGYHLNKRHWNTIELDGTVPDARVREMIDHSHALIVASLPKSQREAIG